MKHYRLGVTYTFFLLSLTLAMAQSKLTGVISDEEANSLPGIAISLKGTGADSNEVLYAVMSTEEGKYEFLNIKMGTYILGVSFAGFSPFEERIVINQPEVSKDILLKPQMLDEVVTTESAYTSKIGKDSYIVTDELKTGVTRADALLNKLDGVNFNQFNRSLTVDGSSNIILLVDGVEKEASYVKGLNPKRIAKVEVIREPTGKYATMDLDAVINIVLVRNYEGIEVGLNLTSLSPKKNLMDNNLSLDMTYTIGKWNLYTVGWLRNSRFNFIQTQEERNNGNLLYKNPHAIDNLMDKNNDKGISLGIDYLFNSNHKLHLSTSLSGMNSWTVEDNRIDFTSSLGLKETYYEYLSNTTYTEPFQIKLYYSGKIGEKGELSAEIRYQNNEVKNDIINENNFSLSSDSIYQLRDNNSYQTDGNISYFHKITERSSVEIGYTNIWSTNDIVGSINYIRDDPFSYSTIRHKGYGYYSTLFAEKWKIKVGGILEYNIATFGGDAVSFFSPQPFVNMSYLWNKQTKLRLKYDTKVLYPSIAWVRNSETTIDRTTVENGNPNLIPATTHNLSLEFNLLRGGLILEPYHSFNVSYINRVGNFREDGKFEYTYENTGEYYRTGIKTRFRIPLSKSLRITAQVDPYYTTMTGNSYKIWDFSGSINLEYFNPKRNYYLVLQSQRQQNKVITAQGYEESPLDIIIFAAGKTLWKGLVNITAFYVLPVLNQVSETVVNTEKYYSLTSFDISLVKNVVGVNVSINFSKGEVRNKFRLKEFNTNEAKVKEKKKSL